jgi:hypothetical protein
MLPDLLRDTGQAMSEEFMTPALAECQRVAVEAIDRCDEARAAAECLAEARA